MPRASQIEFTQPGFYSIFNMHIYMTTTTLTARPATVTTTWPTNTNATTLLLLLLLPLQPSLLPPMVIMVAKWKIHKHSKRYAKIYTYKALYMRSVQVYKTT